jgi:hypothetical protein
MSKETHYCYNCDKEVEVEIKPEIQPCNIGKIHFSFETDTARCLECREEVYIIELQDQAVAKAHNIFKGLANKEKAEKEYG